MALVGCRKTTPNPQPCMVREGMRGAANTNGSLCHVTVSVFAYRICNGGSTNTPMRLANGVKTFEMMDQRPRRA